MIPHIRDSIVAKTALFVMATTSLVMGLVIAYNYIYSKRIILDEAEKNARSLTLSVTRRIEQEFRCVSKVPEGLADYLSIEPFSDKAKLLNLIRSMVADNKEVFGGAVVFEPGAFIGDLKAFAPYYYRSPEGIKYLQLASPTYNYFVQDYYHIVKLLKAPLWTEPYFDEGGGDCLMVTYSVPLFWPEETGSRSSFRGIVTSDVSLEWLSTLVHSVRVAQTGYCFIISDTGVFVTYPNRKYIMRESVFSLAEEQKRPILRQIGRAMIRERSGFQDIGDALSDSEAFLAFSRISATGWALGAVFPKAELLAEITSLHRRMLILAAICTGLLLLVSLFLARSFARPLLKMADAARQVSKGDLDVDLSDVHRSDEVGQLALALDDMVEGLKQRDFIRDTFGRYLTKEVVSRLLESKDGLRLGGESREITLMMSDLRGFTALTSNMRAEDVISFLNRYLGKMVEIMLDHRGTIDEIIGDGILAFFGAPEPIEDHPTRAVACALEMQLAMDEINRLNEADGFAHLEMGVAVHTGMVVVGNIGSERRSKYGAVGSQVNFTGRMESYTVGGQVLVSEATYQAVSDVVDVKNVLKLQMKGVPGIVTLYDIKAIRGKYNVTLPDRDETPRELTDKIKVFVSRVQEKVVKGEGTEAWVTHSSRTVAILRLPEEVREWENIKLTFPAVGPAEKGGEVYAKVTSVTQVGDEYRAEIRLTSMSPEVYGIFRAAAGD